MKINSTEIKNEIVNEIINPKPEQGGTGDSPVVSGHRPDTLQFIKTPEVYSRQGELLTPEHPDYAGILAIITRELSERFQNGDFTLAHFFAPPAAPTSSTPVDPLALPPAPPAEAPPSLPTLDIGSVTLDSRNHSEICQ